MCFFKSDSSPRAHSNSLKTKKNPVSKICGRIPTSLAENDPGAAESMAICSWGKASKTRDNSALCLVISPAECAPSEGVTHGATNGRRKRRAVKALEIDVLIDAPGGKNRGKTQQKLHVQSYLLPGACDVQEGEVERSGAVVHCQCKFSKNSIGSLLPPSPSPTSTTPPRVSQALDSHNGISTHALHFPSWCWC